MDDGWVDGWMDGRIDGWMEGRMVGLVNGRMNDKWMEECGGEGMGGFHRSSPPSPPGQRPLPPESEE